MTDPAEDLVLRLHREEVERIRGRPLQTAGATVPAAVDLPEADVAGPFAEEWKLFRRQLGRLLGEGERGRFALVKAGHAITLWDTLKDAVQAGRFLYRQEPCLVQEVQPFLRPLRMGDIRGCRD